MVSVRVLTCLFLNIFVVYVRADECTIFNFENDVDSSFVNDKDAICTGSDTLSVGNYSELGISSPHSDSTSFVYLTAGLSCGSSSEFSLSNGGTVEVTLYFDGSAATDQIVVFARQDVIVGSTFVSPRESGFVSGWQTLTFTINAAETAQGHITIYGTASEESTILVDSLRYITPGTDEELCVIYSDSIEAVTQTTIEPTEDTTYSTTQTDSDYTNSGTTEDADTTKHTQSIEDINTTTLEADEITLSTILPVEEISTTTQSSDTDATTQAPNGIEDCTTYNFESDFDILFSTDNYLCEGFITWQLDNYTSIGIEAPNSQSTMFISPHGTTSCISSFIFKMEPEGIVEANVFMDPVQTLDHVIILAQRVTDADYDTVAGVHMYHPENQVFVTGWNVIRFSLLDRTGFDGYLLFIGSADSTSTVLVDSVRYIPPQTSPEDPSCSFY